MILIFHGLSYTTINDMLFDFITIILKTNLFLIISLMILHGNDIYISNFMKNDYHKKFNWHDIRNSLSPRK